MDPLFVELEFYFSWNCVMYMCLKKFIYNHYTKIKKNLIMFKYDYKYEKNYKYNKEITINLSTILKKMPLLQIKLTGK